MRRSLIQKCLATVIVVLVLMVSTLSVKILTSTAAPDQPSFINGQLVPLIKQAQLMGTASAEQQLNLSFGLHLRNQTELSALLDTLYNPDSPQYHHFLTPQAFASQFGPTQEQQQQVVGYLHQQGLTVTSIAPNGLIINANATVSQAETAFHVQINNYQLGEHHFFANVNRPSIPTSLSPLILSIGGLDNSVQMHPYAHRLLQSSAGYGPTDLAGAYDTTPLQKAGVQGNNQTVAVFELDGYQTSDISQFFTNNHLGSPAVSNVLVDNASSSAGPGAIEVELDIEVVAEIAPRAAQIVYEGPNTTQGVNDTYNRIVTDNKAQVMTISWGQCEAQSGNAELQMLDNIFQQASAQGISVFSAAGDSGAYDCNDSNLAVDSPSDDPYVTGVGGTNLQESNGVYTGESVWSNPTDTQGSLKGSGGGGGLSTFFSQPSWQTGPGVQNRYSNGKREVPDVSANADPQTGYSVYCTVSAAGCPATGNVVVGGTSAAAPFWAASIALVNEYLQQQGKTQLGSANPILYGLANAHQAYTPFHDVTSGNNLFYPATTGYDLASGLGSPDVYNLARDLASSSTIPVPTSIATITPMPTPQPSSSPTGSLLQNGGEGLEGRT